MSSIQILYRAMSLLWMTKTEMLSETGILHTYLALTMLPAFSSTISSKPMAKISIGLALLSAEEEKERKNDYLISLILHASQDSN